ncbi:unnamed protein product [Microthlaspi erraticum]|uniref:Uncharacterized protein n=1 Tax=Microthlaspi erraticum TaxID=1685480 RepID=A0A6D2HT23_9BRAS|nr:unnamed protein product [Microthlaspi erraticum]
MEKQMERGENYPCHGGIHHYKPGVRNNASIRGTRQYDANQVRRTEDVTRRPNGQGVHAAKFITMESTDLASQEESKGDDEEYHLAEDGTILLQGRIIIPEGRNLRRNTKYGTPVFT